MAEDTIIIKVETDIVGLDDLNKNIENLKKNQEKLNSDFIDGKKTLSEYREETKENSTQLKSQETALKSVTSAVKAQEGSINDLREQNKKLTQERNNLNLSNAEGQKRLKEINDQLDQNNKKIKDNVSSLEQQKINIGNYASALDGVVPGLGGFVNGIDGATKASKAFIATPLGAILAAIALALGAVYKYLEKYEPVLDLIENAVTQVTSAFDSFIQNIDQVGRILGNVLTLNFSKAADEAKNLGDKMVQAAKDGQEIVNLTREIEDATIAFELSSSRVDLQIKRLVIAAKNRTLTAKQQQDLLNQAIELENNQIQENLRIKNLQFEADVKALIQSKKAQVDKNQAFTEAVQQNKTLNEQFEILAKSGIFSPEQLSKALASYKAIDQAEGEGLAFLEKVQNQKDAIAERDQANREKARLDAEKRKIEAQQEAERLIQLQDIESRYEEAERNRISNLNQYRIDSEKSVTDSIKSINQKNENELTDIVKKANKQRENDKKLYNQKVIAYDKAREDNIKNIILASADLASVVFRKNKEAQIASTLISTFVAAQSAFEAGMKTGGPLAPVVATLYAANAVAQGLARVQAIKSINEGGSSSVGTSVSGGRSGVVETQATTNPINQQFALANIGRETTVVASWKEATEVKNRVEFKESLVTV